MEIKLANVSKNPTLALEFDDLGDRLVSLLEKAFPGDGEAALRIEVADQIKGLRLIPILSANDPMETFGLDDMVSRVSPDFYRSRFLELKDLNFPEIAQDKLSDRMEQILELILEGDLKGIVFSDEVGRSTGDASFMTGGKPSLLVNLKAFVHGQDFSWDELRKSLKLAVRFLDGILEEDDDLREINISVAGFASMLEEMDIAYGSSAALEIAERLAQYVEAETRAASKELAEEKGAYPAIRKNRKQIRNASITAVITEETAAKKMAVSTGIEPVFLEKEADLGGQLSLQAAFQKYVDKEVVKTINFPQNATKQDVKDMLIMAYQLGLKSLSFHVGAEKQDMKAPADKNHKLLNDISPIHKKPRIVIGKTVYIDTSQGEIPVTVNFSDQGRPIEIYARLGKNLKSLRTESEALTRMITLSFSLGADLAKIVEELREAGEQAGPPKEDANSAVNLAEAIARALETVS